MKACFADHQEPNVMVGSSAGSARMFGGQARRRAALKSSSAGYAVVLSVSLLVLGGVIVGADTADDDTGSAAPVPPLYASCPGRSYINIGTATGNVARIQTYELDNDNDETEAAAALTSTRETSTTPPHLESGSYPKSAECEWLITGKRRYKAHCFLGFRFLSSFFLPQLYAPSV